MADDESFETIDRIYKLPTHPAGVTMLDEPVKYELGLVGGGQAAGHDL